MAAKPIATTFSRLLPLFDRILILKAEQAAVSDGGISIMIPEKAREKVLRGKVVAVGPGKRNDKGDFIPTTMKIGDEVLLPQHGYFKVTLEDNKEYHIFKETDIIAKFQ